MPTNLKDSARGLLENTWLWSLRDERQLRQWERSGRPVPPPPIVKRKILDTYSRAFSPKVMIETGTFLGDTTYALRNHFEEIFSIELSSELAERAKNRFRSLPHIKIRQGDSADILPAIMREVSVPCLFWLDGHFSGGITVRGTMDTPVMNELETILAHPVKEHIILIDDARLFNGTDDYPTIEQLREFFKTNRPSYDFHVANDVIRIHQPGKVESKL
jgi:hypothetical protein